MNYGKAATEVNENGKRAAREGWNGKGMFVYRENFEHDNQSHDRGYEFEPCIVLHTAQKTWQPGWAPSQADMLADDWCIVEQ